MRENEIVKSCATFERKLIERIESEESERVNNSQILEQKREIRYLPCFYSNQILFFFLSYESCLRILLNSRNSILCFFGTCSINIFSV